MLTQWSFSAALVFAGSSWYERHMSDSFIFNVPTMQQWWCASPAAESAGFTACGKLKWTWQPKMRSPQHAMPCCCVCPCASTPASINTHTHNFAMTILFPSTFGLRDLSSRSRFILQINMHIIILQLLKQCPDCIGCPSLPQHHPLVPGPNVAVYQQRIQIQLLRKQRKECNFASGSLESCDWMRFKENKRTTKTQKLSYRQSLLTAALDSSSAISWHIDLSLEMNSDRLCVYNNYICIPNI